jgi:hypothetical protein
MRRCAVCMFMFCGLVLAAFSPAFAITDNLTRSQVSEALEFGRANQQTIEKTLKSLYGCGTAAQEVVVRTKWCKLALLAGIKAQQAKDVSIQEQEALLQDLALQIDITVYGSSIEFARSYTVHALQDGKKILPDMFHADHFQTSPQTKTAQQGFSSYYATIRAYFRYDTLAVQKPFSLMLVKPSGTQTFEIDPHKLK